MPSKLHNANSPLGGARLESANKLDTSSGFARTELEVAKRSPLQSMTSGRIQLPNGTMHVPKRRSRAIAASSNHPWKIKVFYNNEDQKWQFSVRIGLLNYYQSDDFDADTGLYTGDIPGSNDDVQVGLKYEITAPVNAAGYVMPGFDESVITGDVTHGSLMTIVAEEFDEFQFNDLNLPNADTVEGFAVIPIGKILSADDSYSVGIQVLNSHIYGVFSPVNGFVIYR